MPFLTEDFVNTSPLLVAAVDQEMKILSLSQPWKDVVDADTGEIVLDDLFDSNNCETVAKQVSDVLETRTFVSSLSVSCGSKPLQHGLLAIWSVEIKSNKPVAILVFAPDSELARTKVEYERLQNEHEQLLNSAGEGIYGLDRNGLMTFANQASTEILGWSVEECIGKSAHEVHHHSRADGTNYPHAECPIYAAIKDGQVHRVDCEVFWHADGRPIPVEYTSTPIRHDGELNGAVVVFRDISERLKMQQQREDAYREISELKEQLLLERDYLRDEIKVTANFGEIIGSSPVLKRTLEQVEAVAQTNANVLILGESGVGKEMIARAIHTNSPRIDRPLVKVNCASVPRELFESEFFGHVEGAFTGAHKDRVGRMQLADGGTLFLDEVGEIPLSLQSKLLRVLQEREFEKVGDDQTISADVRVVAATNRDLEAEVQAGRFREDLYYRLSVFPIKVPPLRDRKDDILPLTQYLLETICQSMGKEPFSISRQQGELLKSLTWPGNIRELRNVLERAVILSSGSRLRLDLALPQLAPNPTAESTKSPAPSSEGFLTEAEFQQQEKQNLVAALEHAGWRVSGDGGAADLLGIKPSTLTYRMKSFEIEKPERI